MRSTSDCGLGADQRKPSVRSLPRSSRPLITCSRMVHSTATSAPTTSIAAAPKRRRADLLNVWPSSALPSNCSPWLPPNDPAVSLYASPRVHDASRGNGGLADDGGG